MKNSAIVFLMFILVLILSACDKTTYTDVVTEIVPADYGESVEIAKAEFEMVFSEFDNLKITNISTMVRTDDNVVVQISYSSENGDGVYGFEFQKDEYGNYDILQQGEDVTIDNLLK